MAVVAEQRSEGSPGMGTVGEPLVYRGRPRWATGDVWRRQSAGTVQSEETMYIGLGTLILIIVLILLLT
ncbi:MAG TPA: hypothetical protein VK988_12150 [Acidimicrobiales bacterium]|nr:hypothetical protein [Acidimicrobiales bacterium]